MSMTFEGCVSSTPALREYLRPGLDALRRSDRRRVHAANARRLRGSVDIDAATKQQFPNAHRWDYAIGYQLPNLEGELVYWVEVHPASAGDVRQVLAKLDWLRAWLRDGAPQLNRLQRQFVWVSTGKVSLTPSAPQRKTLAQRGLRFVGRGFTLPED